MYQEGEITIAKCNKCGETFPVFTFVADTDMLTVGCVALTSQDKNIVLTMHAPNESEEEIESRIGSSFKIVSVRYEQASQSDGKSFQEFLKSYKPAKAIYTCIFCGSDSKPIKNETKKRVSCSQYNRGYKWQLTTASKPPANCAGSDLATDRPFMRNVICVNKMDIVEFKNFVGQNSSWYDGVHPVTRDELSRFEDKLGFKLPGSMKWLLSNHGYSDACGIDNLKEAIQQTLECRKSINLPNNILILNDWGDAGVVFCIADNVHDGEYEIIWSDTSELYKVAEGETLSQEADRFENYPAWTLNRLEDAKEEAKYL